MNLVVYNYRKSCLFILLVTLHCNLNAQDLQAYYMNQQYIRQADSLARIGQYEESACLYTKAFKTNVPQSLNDWFRYQAAICYARTKKKKSAYLHLEYLAKGESKYKEIIALDRNQLEADSNFTSLRGDKKWSRLMGQVDALANQISEKLNHQLIARINVLADNDQNSRANYSALQKLYDPLSKEIAEAGEELRLLDSANFAVIDSIVRIHGWPGVDVLGLEASFNLFLIVQHAEVGDQERYLPHITKSINDGKTLPGIRPFIVDRIELHKNGFQLFGTQTCKDFESEEWYICPLFEPEKIEERRVIEGMMSFKEELLQNGIIWNLEEYKLKLPEYIKAYKRDTQ